MKVRDFFNDNGWSQSNNVVGNVVPIIQSYAWKDVVQVCVAKIIDANLADPDQLL
jgi:hypothetical protein